MTPITLGILGGGQLGRMSALAAARLGIKTVIFTPEENSPASFVSNQTLVADYTDKASLQNFARSVNFITYEFENIPIETISYLSSLTPVFPDSRLLEISQDRINEKTYLNSIGLPTARWHRIETRKSINHALESLNANQGILKTTRLGYDGKGQARISSVSDIDTAFHKLKTTPLILEDLIDFTDELSVIVARDRFGRAVTYGPMRNEHVNHILSRTIVPSGLPHTVEAQARAMALQLAEAVNLRGVLAVELFLTRAGDLLVNEIAPRPHNSGHWSLDACAVSQFEAHVRAVCGLPVQDPGRHSDAEMFNLIGEDIKNAERFLNAPHHCVHLYGKSDPRPGRKMGHVTVLKRP